MSQASDTRTCVGCSAQAPTTETDYTLIGHKHAWRCKKATDIEGGPILQWYCPKCWKNQRSSLYPRIK